MKNLGSELDLGVNWKTGVLFLIRLAIKFQISVLVIQLTKSAVSTGASLVRAYFHPFSDFETFWIVRNTTFFSSLIRVLFTYAFAKHQADIIKNLENDCKKGINCMRTNVCRIVSFPSQNGQNG